MVCKTLTVGAVAVPNIYIESIYFTVNTVEVTEITEGETNAYVNTNLVNSGTAMGMVSLRWTIDGGYFIDGDITVGAGQTKVVPIRFLSNLSVGSHNICVEIVG